MVLGALSFNQDISTWDVSNVVSMKSMFFGAAAFNSDISLWNVANCVDMSGLFFGASSFNRDLSGWQVSEQTHMKVMFLDASSFNQDSCSWGSKIKSQTGETMFEGTSCPLKDDPDWTRPSTGPVCFECPARDIPQDTASMLVRRMPYKLCVFLVLSSLILLARLCRQGKGIDPSDDELESTEFELLHMPEQA